MNQFMQHEIDTGKFLYAPMLSIAGNIYQRPITEGLWSILSRARLVAKENKEHLIQEGLKLKLNIKGRPKGGRPINFVIYHVPFDQDEDNSISSFDVPKIDHTKIKHLELVRWTIQAIQQTCPDAEIVVCTDEKFGKAIADLNPTILIPDVDKKRPMYYRVRTYNTIIQSKWLGGTTVFLDSDAVVLKDPRNLPRKLNFKIGVTARFAPNLMPINEGVIITESQSQECINFFAHYMGTYQWIKDDTRIQQVTGNDLMRWRGGQLSLNAICRGSKMTDFRDSSKHVKILPCSRYNYAVRSREEVEHLAKDGAKYIAHIKGKAKY